MLLSPLWLIMACLGPDPACFVSKLQKVKPATRWGLPQAWSGFLVWGPEESCRLLHLQQVSGPAVDLWALLRALASCVLRAWGATAC